MPILVRKTVIVLLSMLAACVYGVVHDQITVRLCPEYFTVAHPPLFHPNSVTLLAFYWGVAATVGIGAVLGFVVAQVSQSGDAAPWPLARVTKCILLLLAMMALSAAAAGTCGYLVSRFGLVAMPTRLALAIPSVRHDFFMADWFAHGASYFVGLSGSAVLCFHVWNTCRRPRIISALPQTHGATLRVIVLAAIVAYIVWARLTTH